MTRLLQVNITQNFQDNLAAIDAFLLQANASLAYDGLLDELLNTVIPNLERFPDIGRPFLNYPIKSVEVGHAIEALNTKLSGAELREYLIADYLLMYVQISDVIYLLSIKHHRQLSFNFDQIW